jgi:hypothetical protein
MTEQEAIGRLINRRDYLQGKIAEREAEGGNTFWLAKDVEAMEIALSAVRYVIEMKEYEASQVPL